MTPGAAPFYCNICTKQRDKDSNRWWVLIESETGHGNYLALMPWDSADAKQAKAQHACGESCALKLLQSWMASIPSEHVGEEGNEK